MQESKTLCSTEGNFHSGVPINGRPIRSAIEKAVQASMVEPLKDQSSVL